MLNITHYQINANQNHNEVPFHASQNGCYPKSLQAINAGEGVEKREPLHGWEEYKLVQPCGEQCGDSLKNWK